MDELDNIGGFFVIMNNNHEEIIKYLKTLENPTVEDIYALPESIRVELIEGKMYYHATPLRIHQGMIVFLACNIRNYIKEKELACEVYSRPFAVLLQGEKHYVEPDVSVICDIDKMDERGCNGAPDWVIEVLSYENILLDTMDKMSLYINNGVREYWIVDPENRKVLVYHEKGVSLYGFTKIKVGIFEDLEIDFETIWDSI